MVFAVCLLSMNQGYTIQIIHTALSTRPSGRYAQQHPCPTISHNARFWCVVLSQQEQRYFQPTPEHPATEHMCSPSLPFYSLSSLGDCRIDPVSHTYTSISISPPR